MKFLSGADDVDRWTEQSLWDAVLANVKIVVSTYQILLDALTHAFVRMESLSLIVFDEGVSIFPPFISGLSLIFHSSQLRWEACRLEDYAEFLPPKEVPRS